MPLCAILVQRPVGSDLKKASSIYRIYRWDIFDAARNSNSMMGQLGVKKIGFGFPNFLAAYLVHTSGQPATFPAPAGKVAGGLSDMFGEYSLEKSETQTLSSKPQDCTHIHQSYLVLITKTLQI